MASFSPDSSSDASATKPLAALIVNPRARGTATVGWYDAVVEQLATRYIVQSHESRSADEVTEIAAHFARQSAALVVAVGGDGTINRVVRGIADSSTALGVIPLGTANDLARELGIPRAPALAARRLVEGVTTRIDLVRANGIPYITVGGLTLVSQSAMMVNRLKTGQLVRGVANVLGSAIYRLAATARLLGGSRIQTRFTIDYDDESGVRHAIQAEAHALFVANHRTLGGGLRLPLDASANDGLMELAWVPARNRPSLTLNFARLSAGKTLPTGVLHVARASRAHVRTDHDDAFVADGELLATGRDFELLVSPHALAIVV